MSVVLTALLQDLTAWRLISEKYKAEAFSGEGARRYGGRWNNKGEAVVYTSSSRSLAILEMLVQAMRLPVYAAIPATLPAGLAITEVDPEKLPESWRQMPAPDSIRALGSEWYAARETCALKVPSAIVPVEFNYVLNPEHPDFSTIRIGKSQTLPMDPRLLDY